MIISLFPLPSFMEWISRKRIITSSYTPVQFWVLVLLKIISGSLFASSYVTEGFLPFIKYFVTVGSNPYSYFLSPVVFPYPSGMLYVISFLPYLVNVLFPTVASSLFIELFLFRLPILIADIGIYLVLCTLIPTKEKKVLLLYFASPVLFYINYFHGQLDVIPTAFLFVSLYFLFKMRHVLTFLMLGLGIASKTHLLITIPFILLYLNKQQVSIRRIVYLTLIPFSVFFLVNIPLISPGFIRSVFNNAEQQRLFLFALDYKFNELSFLVAPALLLVLFYLFYSLKKVNFDSLILNLGLVFTVLIALVPPMQGWFYWSIPLLVFFLIKYKNARLGSFWAMNIAIILFYFVSKNSDIFESLSVTLPYVSSFYTPYRFFESIGLNPVLIQNVLFTIMQVLVAVNAYWCYKIGSYYNQYYTERERPFVFGIAGDSGVGKSTLSSTLKGTIGHENLVILNGDDAHRWERGNKNWLVYTHLNPASNTIHNDTEQLYALVNGQSIERVQYNHSTGRFSKPHTINNNQFILFQGLHPFLTKDLRKIFNFKIYIETEEQLRLKWKIKRDSTIRRQPVTKVIKEIKRRESDAKKFVHPQKEFADWIIRYQSVNKKLTILNFFDTSVPLDSVVEELQAIRSVHITHSYEDMETQVVMCAGKVKKSMIEKIAYKLYPNLNELLNHKPTFKNDLNGITQLLFITYLNFYYRKHERNDKPVY